MGWLHSTERKALPNIITVDPFGTGRPNLDGMLFPDATYESYARNGFGRNELVYACIMYKARTLPQGTLRVYSDHRAEPLEDHRLRRLLAQPNEVTNEVEFLQLSVVHLDLSGNCYWLIVRDRLGLPTELWPVRPDLIRILPPLNPARWRDWRYGYILDPTRFARGGPTEVIPIDRQDIVHTKWPNPLDPYFGQAPLRPATRAVAVDNARTDFLDALLRNDAVPRLVIKTQTAIDDKVVDRLTDRWMRKHGGENRGKPAFLQAGMDVQVLGLDLDKLQFGDLTAYEESRLCMALGVQPILVGAKAGLDRSTFANFKEAKAAFWEDMGMGLQDLFGGAVRTQLLPAFAGVGRQRVDIRWDNSRVLALQEAESERWERATNALARGGITRNMFLATVGLDPVPGGDVFLTPAGVTAQSATGDGVAPAASAEPAELEEPEEPEEPARPMLQAAARYAEDFLVSQNGHGPNGAMAK